MAFESSIPSATIEELLTKVKDVEDNKGGWLSMYPCGLCKYL